MRKKSEIRIQFSFCHENLEPIQISNEKEAHYLAHHAIASFSRRSFCSENLICGSTSLVTRKFENNLSKLRRLNVTSKRRKFFEISKTKVECVENEEVSDARVSPDSEIVADYSCKNEFSCIYCDKQFNSKKDVKSHMRVHTEERPYSCHNTACRKRFKTSSNLRRHEKICKKVNNTMDEITIAEKPSDNIINEEDDNDLFGKILAEHTECHSSSKERAPEIEDYNDMLESLMASVSPDELILKTSISNEMPEDMGEIPDEIPENIDDITVTNCKRKLNEIDENPKKRKKDGRSKSEKIENRNIQFENLVNEKIFRVLNGSTENFKAYNFRSNDLSYTITLPEPDFQTVENFDRKKEEILKHKASFENHKCVQKTKNKKSKRGSLGWQLNHQLEDLDDDNADLDDAKDKPDASERLKKTHDCSHNDNRTKKDAAYNKTILKNLYSMSIASNPPSQLELSEIGAKENNSERINSDMEVDNETPSENILSEPPSPLDSVYNMPVLDFL